MTTMSVTNETEPIPQLYHNFTSAEIVGWFVLYGVITFLAVSGNALVIYMVATRRKLQNVPNYFIVNLAVSLCASTTSMIVHKSSSTI